MELSRLLTVLQEDQCVSESTCQTCKLIHEVYRRILHAANYVLLRIIGSAWDWRWRLQLSSGAVLCVCVPVVGILFELMKRLKSNIRSMAYSISFCSF